MESQTSFCQNVQCANPLRIQQHGHSQKRKIIFETVFACFNWIQLRLSDRVLPSHPTGPSWEIKKEHLSNKARKGTEIPYFIYLYIYIKNTTLIAQVPICAVLGLPHPLIRSLRLDKQVKWVCFERLTRGHPIFSLGGRKELLELESSQVMWFVCHWPPELQLADPVPSACRSLQVVQAPLYCLFVPAGFGHDCPSLRERARESESNSERKRGGRELTTLAAMVWTTWGDPERRRTMGHCGAFRAH